MFQFFWNTQTFSFWIDKWLTQETMQYFAFMILINQYYISRAFIMNESTLSLGNSASTLVYLNFSLYQT